MNGLRGEARTALAIARKDAMAELRGRHATVSTLFSSITPCCDHGVRSPVEGAGCPRSLAYSLKMLSRLRGSGRTSGATEKLSPTACPGVG